MPFARRLESERSGKVDARYVVQNLLNKAREEINSMKRTVEKARLQGQAFENLVAGLQAVLERPTATIRELIPKKKFP
jgi:hypothetical protein